MSKKRSDWHLPEEVLGLLSGFFFLPLVAVFAILASLLLPSSATLQLAHDIELYAIGLAAGVIGIIALFFARLPLYRQRRFLTFGPRDLDRFHRRLYWLAYLFVLASIGLFVIVWFRSK